MGALGITSRKVESMKTLATSISVQLAQLQISPVAFYIEGQVYASQRADPTRTQPGDWWGRYPYGDDPADQEQIQKGIEFCECMGS